MLEDMWLNFRKTIKIINTNISIYGVGLYAIVIEFINVLLKIFYAR